MMAFRRAHRMEQWELLAPKNALGEQVMLRAFQRIKVGNYTTIREAILDAASEMGVRSDGDWVSIASELLWMLVLADLATIRNTLSKPTHYETKKYRFGPLIHSD